MDMGKDMNQNFALAFPGMRSVCCVCTTKDTLYDMLVFQRIVLNLAIACGYVYFLPVGPSGKKE